MHTPVISLCMADTDSCTRSWTAATECTSIINKSQLQPISTQRRRASVTSHLFANRIFGRAGLNEAGPHETTALTSEMLMRKHQSLTLYNRHT